MITVGLVGILGQFKGSHEGIEMLDVYLGKRQVMAFKILMEGNQHPSDLPEV